MTLRDETTLVTRLAKITGDFSCHCQAMLRGNTGQKNVNKILGSFITFVYLATSQLASVCSRSNGMLTSRFGVRVCVCVYVFCWQSLQPGLISGQFQLTSLKIWQRIPLQLMMVSALLSSLNFIEEIFYYRKDCSVLLDSGSQKCFWQLFSPITWSVEATQHDNKITVNLCHNRW